MKAILVIDMPESYMGSVIDVKLYGKEKVVHEHYVNKLKPLPQKMTMEKALKMERVGAIKDIYTAWNACLDEIMGETE